MASKGSEFGGQPGRIQPLPHKLTAAETARLQRSIDPMDEQGNEESQRIVEAGKRGIGPVDQKGDLA